MITPIAVTRDEVEVLRDAASRIEQAIIDPRVRLDLDGMPGCEFCGGRLMIWAEPGGEYRRRFFDHKPECPVGRLSRMVKRLLYRQFPERSAEKTADTEALAGVPT